MTASPLPIGGEPRSASPAAGNRSPRRRASSRKASAVSVTVSAGRPSAARRSGRTRPGGRCPRISGHSEASCTPYRAGEPHPGSSGLRQGATWSTSPSARSRASLRLVVDAHRGSDHPVHLLSGGHPVLRQHGQCHSVPAARVHADHHGPPASRPCGAVLPRRRVYRSGQQPAPTRTPTTRALPHGHEATTPPWTRP